MRGNSIRIHLGLIAAIGIAGAFANAMAFLPSEGQSQYEIPLLQVLPCETRSAETLSASDEAVALVTRQYGGTWRVHSWDSLTDTPAYLIGSGANVAGRLGADAEAEAVARGVIEQIPGVFKADLADLRFDSAQRGMGKVAVHFQQLYHGIEVWQGQAHLTFTEAGRLFVMGSRCYQNIEVDPNPAISPAEAEGIAGAAIGFHEATDRIQDGTQLLVLPVPVSDTDVEYHLVWRVRVETEDPFGVWVTHVDAHSGAIVWRFNDVHFLNFTGDAVHDVEAHSYCSGSEAQDLKYLRVQISGVGEAITAQDGSWTIPYAGTSSATLTSTFYGPYIRVFVVDGSGSA